MIGSWTDMIKHLRISPAAVARQLITHLDSHKRLSKSEESKVMYALENCGVENATDRVLASLSRNTLTEILKAI